MKPINIYEGILAPNKNNLWMYKGELKYYGPNGWESIKVGSPSLNWENIKNKPNFSAVGTYVEIVE